VFESSTLVKKVPNLSNLNLLGLFSQNGVVKIVDPGLSSDGLDYAADIDLSGKGLSYIPIGYQQDGTSAATEPHKRQLPRDLVIQAVITVGGGGFGAENVVERKNTNTAGRDNLVFAGAITEAVQGMFANPGGNNGFRRLCYEDERLRSKTIALPGDMWLESKFLPLPGTWSDARISQE